MLQDAIIDIRNKCSDLECNKERVYYCKTDGKYCCKDCESKIHFECEVVLLQDLDQLKENLKHVWSLVERFRDLLFNKGLQIYLPEAEGALKNYKDLLRGIGTKIEDHARMDDHKENDALDSEIKDIQKDLLHNPMIYKISYLSISKDLYLTNPSDYDLISLTTKVRKKMDKVIKESKEIMEKKMEKDKKEYKKKTKLKAKKGVKQLIEEMKKDAENNQQKIQKQAKKISTLKIQRDQNLMKISDLEDERQSLQKKDRKAQEDLEVIIQETINESENRQKEDEENKIKLIEEIKKNIEKVEELKESIREIVKISAPKGFDPNSKNLTLDLSKPNDQLLMNILSLSKHPLLEMEELKIENIKKEDEQLRQFMNNCVPSSIKLFHFNNPQVVFFGWKELIDIKYYMNELKNILPKVTKEVHFEKLIFDDQDLSDIMKASMNSEELYIEHSKICASPSLDFTSSTPSKIQDLSFLDCKGNNLKNMKWDKSPERFENIIIAIKNSSMKDSLQRIDVTGCSIAGDQVNKLLSTHGMGNIDAITWRGAFYIDGTM